ncbi:MAG: tetratricopeptide repeat protein [Micromonosporaceae bacterium]
MLLRSVGVAAEAVPTELTEAAAMWRTVTADRRFLVLLDDARDTEQVRPLLPGGASLTLVTSRSQLRGLAVRDGAHPVVLRELPAPEAVALLATAIGEDRVAAERGAAEQLVALCGRLPLAVRVAAELVSRFPDVALAGQVAELRGQQGRLDALADADDAASDPRVVFSWSYLTLKPALARAFRLLGLYPGDDSGLPAAAALLDVDEAQARVLLRELTAVHLVELTRPDRYRMHDLLREYATELAAEASTVERDDAIRRLATWSLHSAAGARQAVGYRPDFELAGDPDRLPVPPMEFADVAAANAWLELDWPGLVALTRQLAGVGAHQHVWQLGRMLRHFLDYRRQHEDWVAVAEAGLAAAEASDDALGAYDAALSLSAALSHSGRHAEAEQLLRVGLEYVRSLGEPGKAAAVLSNLAIVALRDGGDVAKSLAYHREALAEARRGAPATPLANTLLNYGYALIETGSPEDGIPYTEEALQLYAELDSTSGQAFARCNLAEAYQRIGQPETALRYAEQALAVSRVTGDNVGIAEVQVTAGQAYAALGDPDRARAAWQEVVALLGPGSDPLVTKAQALLDELDAG